MSEPNWWTKHFRALQKQKHDAVARCLNLVSKHAHKYTSQFAQTLHEFAEIRAQEFQKKHELINSKGERRSLADIAQHNLTNPTVRNAELMVRIKGFEQVGALYKHTAQFFTLTTPSRFHSTLANGLANPKYDGSTPADGQQWLSDNWKLIRAKLHRKGIRPYGFRVVEPHHDGTPHWHLLLFTAPAHTQRLDQIIRHYMRKEQESGSEQHRVKTELIDPEKGSAVGYIAKYISKNLDGRHIDTDQDGTPGKQAAKRIRAWASTWKIRQFQQIGGPSVSVWRELRRLKPEESAGCALTEAHTAADSGDWAAFVIAMGGIDCPRTNRPLGIHRAYRELIDTRTGEITLDDKAWHGGKKPAPVTGLKVPQGVVITRKEVWTTVPTGSPEMRMDSQNPYASRGSQARSAVLNLGPV